jgi:hypothetical protein
MSLSDSKADTESETKLCNCLDTIESDVDVNQYLYELFKNTTNTDDLNLSIFNFFNKYPTISERRYCFIS